MMKSVIREIKPPSQRIKGIRLQTIVFYSHLISLRLKPSQRHTLHPEPLPYMEKQFRKRQIED